MQEGWQAYYTPNGPLGLTVLNQGARRVLSAYRLEGATTEAEIYLSDDRLMGWFTNPAVPGSGFSSRLDQEYLDTFKYDSNRDGVNETEVTFCSTRGNPGPVKWMRNRYAVGERQLNPRTGGSRRP